jgi:ribosomal protein S18 acetylase RimI-like enzyme
MESTMEVAPSLHIHDVEANQIRGLAEVHVRGWQDAYRGILPDAYLDALSIDESERTWRRMVAPVDGTKTVVAELSGIVVGFAGFGPCRDTDRDGSVDGELYAIYVDPRRYRQSIGSALMAHALKRLRQAGQKSAILWVLEENLRARQFYERWSWSPDGVHKTIELGDRALIELRYRRALSSDVH